MSATSTLTHTRLAILREFGDAWLAKDLDRLMSLMTEDCEFRASVGDEPGTTFAGPDEVRRGFQLMLDYDAAGEGQNGIAFIDGDVGASQWSYTYTDAAGNPVEVRGCDIWEFAGDKIRVKDAYRKVHGDITTPMRSAGPSQ
jgi:ketosteroid isomerase-like protein